MSFLNHDKGTKQTKLSKMGAKQKETAKKTSVFIHLSVHPLSYPSAG